MRAEHLPRSGWREVTGDDRCELVAEIVAATRALDTTPGTAEHIHAVARGYVRAALDDPLRFGIMCATPVAAFTRDPEREADAMVRMMLAEPLRAAAR